MEAALKYLLYFIIPSRLHDSICPSNTNVFFQTIYSVSNRLEKGGGAFRPTRASTISPHRQGPDGRKCRTLISLCETFRQKLPLIQHCDNYSKSLKMCSIYRVTLYLGKD